MTETYFINIEAESGIHMAEHTNARQYCTVKDDAS